MKLKTWVISTFGMKGSWKWACRQMDAGNIVRPASATGDVKYKLDHEGQRRILWTFSKNVENSPCWCNANIFLSNFEAIDWRLI